MQQANPSTGVNPDGNGAARNSRGELFALVLLSLVGVVFLFSNLGAKYLWQDEAATAVLGTRLMKYGKPLAYDGVNLITMDDPDLEDRTTIDQRTGDPETAVQYYIDRGDFKHNTAWIGQPWGQFVAVGVSLTLFGHNTVAARLPFVVAALLTIGLLYWLVRQEFQDSLLAWLAAALLVTNVYWVIHSRQCRYYALSGLFLLLTLIAFIRWQRGRPWGGLIFVATAWCWFQVDFGSFWPLVGVLLLTAAWTPWPRVWGVFVVSLALGAAVAPWVWYYELGSRVKTSSASWSHKFLLNIMHLNQFLIPLVLLAAAGVLLALRWRTIDPIARRILSVSLAMLLAGLVWVPSVASYPSHRYIVHLTPLAALLSAWVLCEGAAWIIRRHPREEKRALIAGSLAVFLAICPLFSNLAYPLLQAAPRPFATGSVIRPEWAVFHEEIFAPQPDPNRLTVEALARVAAANDEILINYEDIPLMFYTDYRIRGGIPCFRVEDTSRGPPRILAYRRSVRFCHVPGYDREMFRYEWRLMHSGAPDVPWGNMPEPDYRGGANPSSAPEVIFGENLGPAPPKQAR